MHNLEPGVWGNDQADGRARGKPIILGCPWNWVHLEKSVGLVGPRCRTWYLNRRVKLEGVGWTPAAT